MDDPPLRFTLRFGQRVVDLSIPAQCQIVQNPHIWAALEFDSLQIQFLSILGLQSLENQELVPMCLYRIEDGCLIRVLVEDDDIVDHGTLLTGIPIQKISSQGIMFDVVTEDIRERLLPHLSDEHQASAQNVWAIISPDGRDEVAMEIARARIRKQQMELGLSSTLANPSQHRILEPLLALQNDQEIMMWESLDIRRSGFLTFHDVLLTVAQSEYLAGNLDEFQTSSNDNIDHGLNVATQTSDVSDSSDDEATTSDNNNEALERIQRQVTPVTIHKKPLFWRKRKSTRLMLLHSSPSGSSHAIWLKKPNATWLKCETLLLSDIVNVVSGATKFPGLSDQRSTRLQRRGLSIEYRTPHATEWIHLSMKRSKIRDAWVTVLKALHSERRFSNTISVL